MSNSKFATIEKLRREVGFGCPICRSPFLTWHHFDPPWHVEKHWRPEGIIALCPVCHADADEKGDNAGAYSKEELRSLKRKFSSADDVKGHFPTWQDKQQLLIRFGGCYADAGQPVLSINGKSQVTIRKNEADLLSLSFELRNKSDEVVVKMEDNWFTAYPKSVHDMVVTPKTKEIKVWLTHDDVGLEFSFRRISLPELEAVLSRDREQAAKNTAQRMEELLRDYPRELRDVTGPRGEDNVGNFVKRWATKNCQMDDGLVPRSINPACNFHN